VEYRQRMAASFSVVLFVIADLDRPQEGPINVNRQATEALSGVDRTDRGAGSGRRPEAAARGGGRAT
jgi:hypothetical protein